MIGYSSLSFYYATGYKVLFSELGNWHLKSLNGQNVPVVCKDVVRTAQWTHYISVIRTNQLMLYKAKVAVCSEIHTEMYCVGRT